MIFGRRKIERLLNDFGFVSFMKRGKYHLFINVITADFVMVQKNGFINYDIRLYFDVGEMLRDVYSKDDKELGKEVDAALKEMGIL